MFKKVPQKLVIYSGILACSWVVLPPAISVEIPSVIQSNTPEVSESLENNSTDNNDAMEQVTNVSQLRDVQPTDWAYESLRSLVERYGCIAGYPDGTFRGNRALTRYEFAAGLNACLQQVEKLIAASTADMATKADLEQLQRLTQEFQAELATLGTRVDKLENRTSFLEKHQFSVTTKLNGEALLSLRSVFTDTNNRPDTSAGLPGIVSSFNGPIEKNTILGYRALINLNSSFTGRDQLTTSFWASNISRLSLGAFTNMGALFPDDTTGDENIAGGFSIGTQTGRVSNSKLYLDLASYKFPLSDRTTAQVIATGGQLYDFAPTINPFDYGRAGLGAVSEFGQRNPIYRLSGAGAGLGLDHRFSESLRLSLGYVGGNRASAANPSNGLFNSTYGTIAQLTVSPTRNVDVGLTYVHSYFTTADIFSGRPGVGGGVGSHNSESVVGGAPTTLNSYGVEASIRVSPKFTLGGWAGVSYATAETDAFSPFGTLIAPKGAKGTTVNWALILGFPDLLKPGSLGGIVFGQAPKVTYSEGVEPLLITGGIPNLPLSDFRSESYHIEAFYRYPITDNINITPGVVLITNPEYNDRNPSLILGTIRTTFTF